MIVDDSDLDREILKAILEDDFDIMETDNGYSAIEIITRQRDNLDAVMLDISMPVISGFDVLSMIRANGLNHIPVFLISAEATKENVMRASEYNVLEFISKPFDRTDILRRVKARLGVMTKYWLTMTDVTETNLYISKLQSIFKIYLSNFDKSDSHYVNMSALMKILLHRYSMKNSSAGLTSEMVDIISKAAYLCDIGMMMVPDKLNVISRDPESVRIMTRNHTKLGAHIIRLEASKSCEFFVETCADICAHHHERYDGEGFPDGLTTSISVFSQMCRVVDEFDALLSRLYGANELQANMVLKKVLRDDGLASPEVLSLVEDCKPMIANYYAKANRS